MGDDTMRVLTSSHSTIALLLAGASAGSFFHAFSAGWQGANAGAKGAGVPMIPKPGLRRLAYSLLLLGTVASAAGIWVKLWNPSCSVVSGV
jgi:hypothetical protein